VVRHGEAASANQKAAEEFVQDFNDYVKANGFIQLQLQLQKQLQKSIVEEMSSEVEEGREDVPTF